MTSPCEDLELLREEWPGELSTLLQRRDDTDLSQPNTFFGSCQQDSLKLRHEHATR